MESAASAKAAERILVVDDEVNMRRTLADILTDEGYDVATASTGEQAVELCRKNGFRTVLMDVRMPGMGGVEAFRRIRRHQEGVRVILMSAYSVEALKEAALDDGALAFLTKPLDIEKVVDLVNGMRDTAILVVEDDDKTATVLEQNLKNEGYRVRIAKSAHDALELVEQIRFDLIFLDAKLSAMNGLDLYLAIKQITPKTIAILIADMDSECERIAKEAVRRNVYTVIRKPLDIDQVLTLLERIGGQRASEHIRKPPLEQ